MKKARIFYDNSIEIIDFEEAKNSGYLSDEQLSKYKDFTPSERPEYDNESQSLEVYYVESENEILEKWRKINDAHKIENSIASLKSKLSNTDYIVIKAYEAKLAMIDIPYAQEYLDKIILERQELRDRINELEKLLK